MRARAGGVTGVVARLVAPEDVVSGHLTSLVGVLWLTGGGWLLLAGALGLFEDGASALVLGITAVATVLGVALLVFRHHRLPEPVNVTLTLLGAAAISLVTLWSGPVGSAVAGVVFVYVSCFSFIALRRWAVAIVLVAGALHLGALLLSDHPAAFGVWLVTWGSVTVTGLVAGAAVEWLRHAVDLLRDVDEHKTRFIGTISHELRTPLTAILGATQTLDRQFSRLTEEQRGQFLDMIERQATRQLRLVNDVLVMTTQMAGASPPRRESVDVAALVESTLEALPFPVTVTMGSSERVIVDVGHFQQVLENLLVNADRYGEGPIEVTSSGADPDMVTVAVVDHGAGLPGGIEGGLLEPFVQGDSGDRRVSSGVGLGLTICRDLVAANGGRLEYADTPGGGATFRLLLPRA